MELRKQDTTLEDIAKAQEMPATRSFQEQERPEAGSSRSRYLETRVASYQELPGAGADRSRVFQEQGPREEAGQLPGTSRSRSRSLQGKEPPLTRTSRRKNAPGRETPATGASGGETMDVKDANVDRSRRQT